MFVCLCKNFGLLSIDKATRCSTDLVVDEEKGIYQIEETMHNYKTTHLKYINNNVRTITCHD